MKKKVLVFTTGGTIEKSYNEFDGSLSNQQSVIKQALIYRLRIPYVTIEFHEIMAKDSLDMTDKDRKILCTYIKDHMTSDSPILVTHGTDRMEDSANYCWERIKEPIVPIVFTGAMKPMGFEGSDAIQNFTEALFACQNASPGFYVSFHGKLYKVPNVRKNKKRGTFETID